MKKFDAVLPITARDVDRAFILIKSLEIFGTDLNRLWVVTPNGELDYVRRKLTSRIPTEFVSESVLIQEFRWYFAIRKRWPGLAGRIFGKEIRGWFMQQVVKLAIAQRIDTDFYLTLDADNVLVRELNWSDVVIEGKSKVQRFEAEEHPDWYAWSARLLGMEKSKFEHGVTPCFLSREACLRLIEYLESKSSSHFRFSLRGLVSLVGPIPSPNWISYLVSNFPWTEYGIYFTYLENAGLFDRYHVAVDRSQIYNESTWSDEQFSTWRVEDGSHGRHHFVVLQSRLSNTAIETWEKLRDFLLPKLPEGGLR